MYYRSPEYQRTNCFARDLQNSDTLNHRILQDYGSIFTDQSTLRQWWTILASNASGRSMLNTSPKQYGSNICPRWIERRRIKLACNYERGFVDTSMGTYVGNQLIRYAEKKPDCKKYNPYAPAPVLYKKASQDMPEPDTSHPFDTKDIILCSKSCLQFSVL